MKAKKLRIKRFMESVKDSGGIQSLVARRMGITRQSLNEWLDRNPEFWKYIEEEDYKRFDTAQTTITNDLKNTETAKWFLTKYKIGQKYGYKDKPETQVNVQNNTIEQTKIIIEVVDGTKDTINQETIRSIPISDR